jgi:protoporphyrinogen oxidase
VNRDDFIYTTLYIIGIGASGPRPEESKSLSWAYFPDRDIPFYRISWHSNYSNTMVPDPEKHWSLLLEVNIMSLPEELRDGSEESRQKVT